MSRKYEKCFICEEFGMIEIRTPNRKPICRHCTYKLKRYEKCICCGNNPKSYDDNKMPICNMRFDDLCRCEKCGNLMKSWRNRKTCKECSTNTRTKQLCSFCGNLCFIANNRNKTCNICNSKTKIDTCDVCNNITEIVGIRKLNYCRACFKDISEKCQFCDKLYIIIKSINGIPICNSCYLKKGDFQHSCNKCGTIKKAEHWQDKLPLCKSCYSVPLKTCSMCDRIKPIKKNTELGKVCDNCYMKYNRSKSEKFRITQLLRSRLSGCLREWSEFGKTKSSDEYGVNYSKIIEHLGPCPGNREDYHIDHIFPLIAFDFNNLKHIKIAFSPENHQWLTKKENLKKGDKYNKDQIKEFINVKMRELS